MHEYGYSFYNAFTYQYCVHIINTACIITDQVAENYHTNFLLGKWMSPTINGDTLPPVSSFTLTSLTSDSAVLFGGATPDGPSDSIYFVNFTKESVVS